MKTKDDFLIAFSFNGLRVIKEIYSSKYRLGWGVYSGEPNQEEQEFFKNHVKDKWLLYGFYYLYPEWVRYYEEQGKTFDHWKDLKE